LSKLYQNVQPEYQPFSLSGLVMFGKVFLYYDPMYDKTFIFARIQGVPSLSPHILQWWLQSQYDDVKRPWGPVEMQAENGILVAYAVRIEQGDTRKVGKNLIFSFEKSTTATQPESVLIEVKF
jgi:hypothetical protein